LRDLLATVVDEETKQEIIDAVERLRSDPFAVEVRSLPAQRRNRPNQYNAEVARDWWLSFEIVPDQPPLARCLRVLALVHMVL
jgi:hypothetical protein